MALVDMTHVYRGRSLAVDLYVISVRQQTFQENIDWEIRPQPKGVLIRVGLSIPDYTQWKAAGYIAVYSYNDELIFSAEPTLNNGDEEFQVYRNPDGANTVNIRPFLACDIARLRIVQEGNTGGPVDGTISLLVLSDDPPSSKRKSVIGEFSKFC